MIKIVLFDIDNTLLSFDGYVKQCMKEGFEKYHLKKYEDWMFYTFKQINDALWISLEKGEITFEQIKATRFNKVFDALGINFDGPTFEAYFRECLHSNAIPMEGALEILEYLSDKYILGVASNGPYKQQVNRLTVAKMIRYFDYLFISEELGASKPSKEFIDKVFGRLNVHDTYLPEEILIVGDSITSDIMTGINAGMKTVYYNPNRNLHNDDVKMDYEITSLLELKSIL